MDVDWMEGAALFVRRKAIDEVGLFDERYFAYFEDADWCRRFWLKGWKVVHFPEATVIHYHRRESADALWFLAPFTNKVSRIHISSAVKYFLKWKGQPLPR
jgi:GT2 family glycosyltransferase